MKRVLSVSLGLLLTVASSFAADANSDAVAGHIKRMKSNDVNVRNQAMSELVRIGEPAVGAVSKEAKQGNAADRGSAIAVLSLIGPAAKEAVPTLLVAMQDMDSTVATNAALALGRIGSPAASGLVQALKNSNPRVRGLALGAIKHLGPDAKDAVPVLIEMVKKTNNESVPAIEALGRIGLASSEAVPLLIETLDSKKPAGALNPARIQAVVALGRIGPNAAAAVPALTKLVHERDKGGLVSHHAVEAIGGIGPDAKAAVPALIQILEDEANPARTSAAISLGQIGPKAKDAAPALTKAAGLGDTPLGNAARKSLQKIEGNK